MQQYYIILNKLKNKQIQFDFYSIDKIYNISFRLNNLGISPSKRIHNLVDLSLTKLLKKDIRFIYSNYCTPAYIIKCNKCHMLDVKSRTNNLYCCKCNYNILIKQLSKSCGINYYLTKYFMYKNNYDLISFTQSVKSYIVCLPNIIKLICKYMATITAVHKNMPYQSDGHKLVFIIVEMIIIDSISILTRYNY